MLGHDMCDYSDSSDTRAGDKLMGEAFVIETSVSSDHCVLSTVRAVPLC